MPPALPAVHPADDFPRTPEGLAGLLATAGLREADCRTVDREHPTTVEQRWRGPTYGVATIGPTLLVQTPETRTAARGHYDRLAEEYRTGPDGEGGLLLPHGALLASAVR